MGKQYIVWATCAEEDKEVDPENLEELKNAEHSAEHRFNSPHEARAFIEGMNFANGWMGNPIWKMIEEGKEDTACITWSVDDFEHMAREAEEWYDKGYNDENPMPEEEMKYDRSTFYAALDEMVNRRHDACHGVCWDTISDYLDIHCEIQK